MSSHLSSGPECRFSDGRPAPVVSVIIIFLNPGTFLAEAIESILGQTCTDWEIVLVDDGSSDESTTIAKRWVERRPAQIRYVEHPGHVNRGMSASRNLGVRSARGRYVAFLDADDVYLPNRLSEHVAVLDKMPQVAMVQSEQIYWYQWRGGGGRVYEELCRRVPLFLGDSVIRPPQGLLMLFGVPDAFTAPCSVTIRRAVAIELGGFEEQFRTLYEDQVFLTKVYTHCTVFALQAYLAKYRVHAGGTFSTAVASIRGTQGAFFETTRRLRDWQSLYLANVLADRPLLRELLAGHIRRSREQSSMRRHAVATIWRQLAHRMMRRFFPLPIYRRMLQRRQAWSADRAKRQHRQMCERMAGERLALRLHVAASEHDRHRLSRL